MPRSQKHTLELLNLNVGNESFALNIINVQEIRVLEGLRRMPNAPECWLGVIDFRDMIVPIVDLRKVFSCDSHNVDEKTVVVIVQIETEERERMIGMVVDAVSDVMSVSSEDIKSPPDMQNGDQHQVIMGVFKHEGHIVLLLDVEGLLSSSDFESLQTQLLVTSDAV